jgi:predicted transcriptional regulator
MLNLNTPTPEENDETLAHYGILRRSGRYPWGSGKDPYQRSLDFQGLVKGLEAKGMSEAEIARGLGMTTTELRATKSIAKRERQAVEIAMVRKLDAKNMSQAAIAERLGISSSTVRNYLKEDAGKTASKIEGTADILKREVDKHRYIDIGAGTEVALGTTATSLKLAAATLEAQGYSVQDIKIRQLGTDNYTSTRVLVAPGVKKSETVQNLDQIHVVGVRTDPQGNKLALKPPAPLDSKRVMVRYAEDGGTNKDGVIEIRRGLKDLNLGKSNYAQVRISVDGTHYLKGMAVYADDLPAGKDIRFNTNKSKKVPMISDGDSVLKRMKDDPDNPFGAIIRRQMEYIDKDGKKKLSPINLVNEEGSWGDWSRTLSAQFLSKQDIFFAKQQLDISTNEAKEKFRDIMSLTNPVLRKKALKDFADSCDSDSVRLKAAAVPGQAYQVILPVTSLKPTEVYAPNFKNGEKVALVRYPHGGTFEIPILTVNNGHKESRKTIGELAADAIGINHKVAARLSGADFDGDTVLVVPVTAKSRIRSTSPLKGLEGFDPSAAYPGYPGMKVLSEKGKQKQMGEISNLITDMTIKGATEAELAKAVRHSMVVIDAAKHKLDYRTSAIDNGIAELKKKYQPEGGVSTLISRAASEVVIPKRKPRSMAKGGPIDPLTGRKVYEETGETYSITKEYKTKPPVIETRLRTSKATRMELVDDARKLSSGTPMENLYARYANNMKVLANTARREIVDTPTLKRDPAAAKEYAAEVSSLKDKVRTALTNAPRERQAQLIAGGVVKAKVEANPDITKEERTRLEAQALKAARLRTGASRKEVQFGITDREWKAIMDGAVSNAMMESIARYADPERLHELSMPKDKPVLSTGVVARARAMARNGATTSEIAEMLGISTSSVLDAVKGV